MSRTCQTTNANVETIFKVSRAPNTSPMWVGYKLSRNFVNVKICSVGHHTYQAWKITKIFIKPSFLNEYFQVWWDKSSSIIVSLGVTDQFQIYIIFFHEIKLVQDPISCLNKTNRSSKIPSQIVSFVIKMFLGKEYLMR